MSEDFDPKDSNVRVLTNEKDADDILQKKGSLMLVIYMKGCSHCMHIYEPLKKASKKLGDKKIYMIESSHYSNVTSFPTITINKNGKITEYMGDRDEHSFVKALGLRGRRSTGGLRRRARKLHRTLRRNIPLV